MGKFGDAGECVRSTKEESEKNVLCALVVCEREKNVGVWSVCMCVCVRVMCGVRAYSSCVLACARLEWSNLFRLLQTKLENTTPTPLAHTDSLMKELYYCSRCPFLSTTQPLGSDVSDTFHTYRQEKQMEYWLVVALLNPSNTEFAPSEHPIARLYHEDRIGLSPVLCAMLPFRWCQQIVQQYRRSTVAKSHEKSFDSFHRKFFQVEGIFRKKFPAILIYSLNLKAPPTHNYRRYIAMPRQFTLFPQLPLALRSLVLELLWPDLPSVHR